MSKGYHSKYPSPISQGEDFFQSDFSTEDEQRQAIINALNGGGTGINKHAYTGNQGQTQGMVDSVISPISLGSPLYESNGGEYIPRYGGHPIFNYPPDALMDCLAIYNKSKHTNYLLEPYRDFLWSGEYFPYYIVLPYNANTALITWRQTFRDQVDVPPKSYLIAIQAKAFRYNTETEKFDIDTSFRLQIYDDGAGEYVYESSVRSSISAGNDTPVAGNGNSFGPFIPPSPLCVVPNGMLVVQMINTEATGILVSATDGAINAYIGLLFAVPRNCGPGVKPS